MKDWANPSKGGDAKLQGLHRMVSQPAALTGTTGSEQVAFVLPEMCIRDRNRPARFTTAWG